MAWDPSKKRSSFMFYTCEINMNFFNAVLVFTTEVFVLC